MSCRDCGYYPLCDRCKGPKGSCEFFISKRDKSGEAVKEK